MNTKLPIAFIGVGAIGLPMALRLNAVTDVVAVEPFAPARVAAQGKGLHVVPSVADLPQVAHAIVMVATPDQLRQVVVAEKLASKVSANGTISIMSTVGVDPISEVAKALINEDVVVIDAPVTGGVTGAQAGTLKIYVSGPPTGVAAMTPHYEAFGEPILLGENLGNGQAAKLVNNLLVTTHVVVAAEALNFAASLNVDPEVVLPGLLGGAAYSWSLSEFGPEMLREEPSVMRAMLRIFMKDSDLIEDEGHRRGTHMPVMDAVQSVLRKAAEMDLGSQDSSRVIEVYRAHAKERATS